MIVGKRVEAVMMTLRDLKGGVQIHPVEQVSHLAQTASNSQDHLALGELQTLHKAALGAACRKLAGGR